MERRTSRAHFARPVAAERRRSGRRRQALERAERPTHLFLVERDVLELAGEVVVVGGHVEMAVAGEVEQDRALLAGLVGGARSANRAVNRVRGLGRREDALAAGEEDG